MKLRMKSYKRKFIVGMLTFLVFVSGIVIGNSVNFHPLFTKINLVSAQDESIINEKYLLIKNLKSPSRSNEVSFDLFWKVWDKVKTKHFDQSIKDEDLFYGAMEGMVASLNDPYTVFFPPKLASEFVESISGKFEGIGAEIGLRDDILTVIAPLPESPAEKSGVKSGDKIIAIDGTNTTGMTVEKAVSLIRGLKDTTVVLNIIHKDTSSAIDISIIRDKIQVPSIYKQNEEDDIVYVRIAQFNQDTTREFDEIVSGILNSNTKGIILDLRNNPGGFLESAIDVAGEWVDSGLIVTEKLVDGSMKPHYTRGKHRLKGIPTVVLIDGGSASGSEIVAGALQDFSLATLVGEKSFGKGSVQDFEVFDDGSALKITIAKWYTPLDREIDKNGILPDVKIEKMFAPMPNDDGSEPLPDAEIVDFGKKKALEILRKK